ncbi:MAG: hypothetical protein ACK5FX_03485 [Flavobacteriia bacterium]|jgi:hypothetical protein
MMRLTTTKLRFLIFTFSFFQCFVVFGQTKFYFYSGGSNANNGFSVNTGGTWNTVNYPTYTDAENLTNAGCLSMNCNATITGGNFLNSSGSNLSLWSPKWQNVSATYDFYGQRIYADFTTSNSTTSYATVIYTFTSSGSAINLPITFDLFDINSGAYTLDASSILNFIDFVQITARTASGVNVNPIFSNQCGSPTDEFGTNTIKGNISCGGSPTRDVTVSFAQNISELTIKYMPGSGEPGNIAAATTTGTGFPIATAYNPGRQFIDISPIRIGSISPTISAQPSNASICPTGSAILSITASAGPYQWQYNNAGTWQNVVNSTPVGVSYSGQTTNTLSINGSNVAAGSYSYRCVVGASCSSVNSSNATLTVSAISTVGMVANDWVWTGAQSTTYETAGNWLSWNGSSFAIPPATPSSSNNVRIKPVSGCIVNSPIITTSGANCNGITIESSAQITSNNSTNLTVAGNWSNSGTYIENQGKITFTGSGKTLTCSGGETFYDLSSASTSILTLNNDATVSKGLWLNGIISTGMNRVNLNTSAIDGVSTGVIDGNYSGHINGNFRRTVSTNTATYRFPMGVGTTLTTDRRLMEWVNNNLTGVSYLDCSVSNSFKGSGQNTDLNISSSLAVQNGKVVFLIHPEAQWRLGPNTNPTGGSYGMRLYVQNFSSLSASSDNKFIVLKRPDNSATFADYNTFESTTTIPAQNLAGRVFNSGNGYAQRLGFTSFSEFVIGSVPTPLGVELGTFDLKCDRDGYMLNYSTVSEINSSHFQISTSNNGYDFTVNSEVDAQGYSSSLIEYQIFIAKGSYNYVQLKQFDFDGQSEELFTLHVPSCDEGPKPFIRQDLNEDVLVILPYNAPSDIFLYSTDGKLLFEGNSAGVENEVFELPRELFTVGTYFLRVDNKMVDSEVFKFIKF